MKLRYGKVALMLGLAISLGSVSGSVLAETAVSIPALSLEQCIQLALKASPEAISREESLQRAKLSADTARANLRPGLSGNRLNVYKSDSSDEVSVNGSFGIRLPFGNGLGTTGLLANSVSMSKAELDMSIDEAQASYAKSLSGLVLGAKLKYFSVIKARQDYELAKTSLQRYKSIILPDVQTKKAKGFASEVDLLRAQATLANYELSLSRSLSALTAAEKALQVATGLEVIPALTSSKPDEQLISGLVASKPEELGIKAYAARYDSKEAANDVERAKMALTKAKSQLLPAVSVSGSIRPEAKADGLQVDIGTGIGNLDRGLSFYNDGQLNTSVSLSKARQDRNELSWDVSLNVAAPFLLDYGNAKREVQKAQMNLDNATKAEATVKSAVFEEVKSAHASLVDVWTQWQIAKLNAKVDELAAAEAKAKLAAGVLTQLAYEDQINQISANETNRVVLGHELIMAADRLVASLGTSK